MLKSFEVIPIEPIENIIICITKKLKNLFNKELFSKRSDYSPRSGANSYKAGNDDVFSLIHAETDSKGYLLTD